MVVNSINTWNSVRKERMNQVQSQLCEEKYQMTKTTTTAYNSDDVVIPTKRTLSANDLFGNKYLFVDDEQCLLGSSVILFLFFSYKKKKYFI